MSELPHNHTDESQLSHILEHLRHEEDFDKVASILSNFSDRTRVKIFFILAHTEECVIDLAAMINMSSPAVSHHLRCLKESGLIESRREGKEVYYKAVDNELGRLAHIIVEEIMSVPCPDVDAAAGHTTAGHSCCHTGDSGDIHFHHTSDDHSHCPGSPVNKESSCDCNYHPGRQSDLAEEIHEYLTEHLDRHITIESLARHFLVNPTTIKQVFKETYGNSIAAHIREHRMERAAFLLTHTDKSIAEIATEVGFSSQSKFTQVFKETYHVLPSKYPRE